MFNIGDILLADWKELYFSHYLYFIDPLHKGLQWDVKVPHFENIRHMKIL